jgi:hypothetical protein
MRTHSLRWAARIVLCATWLIPQGSGPQGSVFLASSFIVASRYDTIPNISGSWTLATVAALKANAADMLQFASRVVQVGDCTPSVRVFGAPKPVYFHCGGGSISEWVFSQPCRALP